MNLTSQDRRELKNLSAGLRRKLQAGVTSRRRAMVHPKDNLLDPMTVEDLVTAVYANERNPTDAQVIQRTFDEMLKTLVADAKASLRDWMPEIQQTLADSQD